MFVAEDIFDKIQRIYYQYNGTKDDKLSEFLHKNRRKLKIIVDSLWEQIISNRLNKRPRNATEALRTINIYLNSNPDYPDKDVLFYLGKVLENYKPLDDKSYIDYTDDLLEIMDNHFYHLTKYLCMHPELKDNKHAASLLENIES